MDQEGVDAFHQGTGLLHFRVLNNLTRLEQAYEPVSLAHPGQEVMRLRTIHLNLQPWQSEVLREIPFLFCGIIGRIEMGYSPTALFSKFTLARIAEQLITEAGSPIGFYILERRIHNGIIDYRTYHFTQAINGPILGPRMTRLYELVLSNSCNLTVAYVGTSFAIWRLWVHWIRRTRTTMAFFPYFGDHIATLIGLFHDAHIIWNLRNTPGGLSERTEYVYLQHNGLMQQLRDMLSQD